MSHFRKMITGLPVFILSGTHRINRYKQGRDCLNVHRDFVMRRSQHLRFKLRPVTGLVWMFIHISIPFRRVLLHVPDGKVLGHRRPNHAKPPCLKTHGRSSVSNANGGRILLSARTYKNAHFCEPFLHLGSMGAISLILGPAHQGLHWNLTKY